MAHSALHFTVGMLMGSAAMLPPVLKAWRGGDPLARKVQRWLLVSYALGIYAVIPSLLHWIGLPAGFCTGWWMNVFLLHPSLSRLHGGGMIPAGAAIVLCFAGPYLVLLAAVRRARRRRLRSPGSS